MNKLFIPSFDVIISTLEGMAYRWECLFGLLRHGRYRPAIDTRREEAKKKRRVISLREGADACREVRAVIIYVDKNKKSALKKNYFRFISLST
jgi:hypothetical protein